MTSPPIQRRRITFEGRVQGVGFRATTRALARSYPVTGWVQNEPDGSVVVEVQGSSAAVDGFMSDLRTRMGRFIRRESAASIPLAGSELGFEVRV